MGAALLCAGVGTTMCTGTAGVDKLRSLLLIHDLKYCAKFMNLWTFSSYPRELWITLWVSWVQTSASRAVAGFGRIAHENGNDKKPL
jgi:hypothetical protein